MSLDLLPALAVALPLLGAGVVALLHRWPDAREAATLTTGGALFWLVLSLLPAVQGGSQPGIVLGEVLPGLTFALKVEPLGMLFSLVASFLWIVTTLYAIGYMRAHHEENQTRFYLFFAVAIACAMGVAFAANMFTLFIFYEALTFSTFPLVTHAGTPEAKRAGRVYLGILVGTSIGFQLFAVVLTWLIAGSLDFTAGGILAGKASTPVLSVLFALYVFGVGKSALMPFHRWLPAAMVAPTPVSALLHAVAVVKAGVFTLLKISVYLFGMDLVSVLVSSRLLAYLAGATIILASLIAFTKDNLKARLAYSTISQLSYIVLGAMLANRAGIIGGGMHIAMHAFGKITLFFCAGAVLVAAHKTEVSEMRGLGRAMPITMAAFFIGALSIIGIPPAGGTWSKWYLGLGTLQADELGLLAVLMISSLLSIGYLLVIPVRAFFSPPDDPESLAGVHEAPAFSLAALVITAIVTLGLFIYPDPVYHLMRMVVAG